MSTHSNKLFAITLMSVLFFANCNSTGLKDADTADGPTVKRNVKPIPEDQVAVIETADFGNIIVELYPNIAPQMVERFKKLIQEGFYDGTAIHRINAGGLLQGGDPFSRDNNPNNDGMGDSPYPNVPAEFSDVPFERGTLGAARKGAIPAVGGRAGLTEEQARNTANCQFFITLSRAPDYDEEYTVFGSVIEGISNAEVIAGAPVVPGTDRPAEKIVITTITLQPRSRFVSQ